MELGSKRKLDERGERGWRIVEALVFRGAHFAVPWRVSRVFNINIMHCAGASKPPHVGYARHPSQDTRVYKRSGAARGLSSSSRQSWYCAPAYTYVTRDLRQYTMSEPYSTAALKTGRIETQLPPLNAHRSRRSRRERQGSISRVQTFSEIFDPRSRTHGANKILNNM